MAGVGVRYAVLILMSVLRDYFDRHFSVANSLAISGTCFGVMIFAPLTQLFLDTYGWRGALFLLGAIYFNLAACGALLRHDYNKKNSYKAFQNTDSDGEQGPGADKRWTVMLLCEKLNQCSGDFELGLFKDPSFLVWISTNCLLEYTWAGWLIYLVPHAEDKGLSPYQATSLATLGGLGFLLGLFPTGYIADKNISHFGSDEIRALTLFLGGIALLVDPLFDSMVVLTLLSMLFGSTIGSLKVTSYSSAKNINGDFTQILSWLFTFTSLAKLASGFLTGKHEKHTY